MTTDHSAADLAIIQNHITALGVAEFARQIRAQRGQLAEFGVTPQLPAAIPAQRARRECVTVHPVLVDQPEYHSWWYVNRWRLLSAAGIAITLCGLGFAIVWVVSAIAAGLHAAVAGIGDATPSLGGIILLGLLALFVLRLCGRGGSSKSISGTFEGRIHD